MCERSLAKGKQAEAGRSEGPEANAGEHRRPIYKAGLPLRTRAPVVGEAAISPETGRPCTRMWATPPGRNGKEPAPSAMPPRAWARQSGPAPMQATSREAPGQHRQLHLPWSLLLPAPPVSPCAAPALPPKKRQVLGNAAAGAGPGACPSRAAGASAGPFNIKHTEKPSWRALARAGLVIYRLPSTEWPNRPSAAAPAPMSFPPPHRPSVS